MDRKPARVLTVAGSDSGGGAGIQADLKTITVLGGFGMSVITALTAQNTLGVQGIFEVPIPFIEQQFDAVATDIGVDAAKTGMLVNAAVVRAVAAKIRQYHIEKLVVDPVMVAKGGALLIENDARENFISELVPLALVLTPNIPEAEALAGLSIRSVEDMKEAAMRIREMGVPNVIVKGGHLQGPATDIFFDGRRFYEFYSERIATKDSHGTGCTYSSAIATGLAVGKPLLEAVREAKAYVTEVIRYAWRIGQGHGPTNHAAPLLNALDRILPFLDQR
ncbi:hydroxymethylpyrimidine/phosphomethylpyrimidine kinase [Syntrophus gentianae]|uniref:hydroxymethylpyrimidine kinase n=1 Tax=Syntrophus gentianae TaxID=43775 RepID=A0A1H7XNE2_9BACT|nr:bifunctional hydroxymethylpyrimidine kinase/phosphomethylpyrimidine kinase [Syntrophus gentianae]SEM34728.1 hydroxymethylpyrimidine/phosphomethylpyrimidine kinase [Syntrophus gentianae]